MNELPDTASNRDPAPHASGTRAEAGRAASARPSEPAPLHLAGRSVRTVDVLPVHDPWTGERLADAARAGPPEIEVALDAARAYARDPLPEPARAALLRRWADAIDAAAESLARTLTAENGKPLADARTEVARAAATARRYADAALELNAGAHETVRRLIADADSVAANEEGVVAPIFHRPLGVVAAFTPYNFPANTVVHKIGAAVAAGNACVLKPSEKTPLTALALAGLFAGRDAPPMLLSVLSGHWSDFLGPFLDDPRVDFFTMTGHSDVGRRLARRFAAAHPFGRSHFELGGNAAQIVLDDVPAGEAAALVAGAVFDHNGSRCTTPRKVLVPEGRYRADFVAAAAGIARACPAGDPFDPATRIGPLIDDAAADLVEARVRDAVRRGARLVAGGGRRGRVVEATVLDGVEPGMRIFDEENFGPVPCVLGHAAPDDAVRVANLGAHGLQPAVLTHDAVAGFALAARLRGGCVNVGHATTAHRSDLVPFGGVGDSGCGKEGGVAGVREMCVEVAVKFHRPPA